MNSDQIPKSIKILTSVHKELKKFSPTGASKRIQFTDPKLPKGQSERIAKKIYTQPDRHKYLNAPLLSYLESNYKVKDAYTRYSKPPRDPNRLSTASPNPRLSTNRTPDRSPELFRIKSQQRLSELEDVRSLSPRLDTVNGIIEACENAGSPKETIIPQVLKGYSKQMTQLGNQVEKVIRSGSSGNWDGKRIEMRIAKEFYDEEGKREMVETELVDKKIKREGFRVRPCSMPRHLENFLRKHTVC